MVIDLHTHSAFSDGSLTPSELVARASAKGVSMVALTDHDTIGGVAEALAAAGRTAAPNRVTLIPGVELSAWHEREVHMLGYFSPGAYRRFAPYLKDIQKERAERNARVLEKLNSLGIRISDSDIAEASGKPVFGRVHIADALVRKGAAHSIGGAFREYLGEGGAAYVPRRTQSPSDCVAAIAAVGGLPSLAHPVHIGFKLQKLHDFARGLKRSGLGGIEAYYPDNTPQETRNFAALASELGLIATGGSDFHGAYRPGIELGIGRGGRFAVPPEAAAMLMAALGM